MFKNCPTMKPVTEKDFFAYNIAIQKAINNHEVPVKQKHERSTIIGTFQEQGAQNFWAVALRLPFMNDRIVAWKLCYVVYKVLREGHPLCLVHSQPHKDELDDVGRLWCHLGEQYGKMIRLYANLLMTKLDFHMRNPRFPGHLGVTNDELESIGSNDINNYFQLSVEMFDYMDNILELQEAIFASTNRSNSMTSAGQCRLAPLIMCIQDASRLYDYCVKILFQLHSTLPADLLVGHRNRFLQQFQGLKKFYQSTNALQYLRNLISIPPLPEKPPDFLFASESRTYVTQEVFVPPEEDEIEEATPQNFAHPAGRQAYPPMEMLAERDDLIKHLQSELEKMTNENVLLRREKLEGFRYFHEQIALLQTNLATKESELVHERQIKNDLFHQVSTEAQSKDSEQKLMEEKFNKLIQIYQNLRTEHIDLLKLKAEVVKKYQMSSNRHEESQQKVVDLEIKIRKLQHESTKLTELRQTSQQQDKELLSLRRDKDLFNRETEILKNLEDVIREKAQLKDEIEIEKLDKEQSRLKIHTYIHNKNPFYP